MTAKRTRGFRIDPRIKVDPDDLDRLRAIGHAVYVSNGGYAWFSTSETGPVAVHQFVMDRIGRHGDGLVIDHINGDRLDNRKENLRLVSDLKNQINRHVLNRNNTSGRRGVAPFKMSKAKPWRAFKAICRRCPAVGECRAYALTNPGVAGIWGGWSQKDRQDMRRETPQPKRQRTRCAQGHAYTPENTRQAESGRRCRTCHNRANRKREQREQEAAK